MPRYLLLAFGLILNTVACTPAMTQPGSSMQSKAISADENVALDYLKKHKNRFNLSDPKTQLTLQREQTDNVGLKHLRFFQHEDGVVFLDQEIIVHINKEGDVYRVDGVAINKTALSKTASIDSSK